ncbi:MAG TPA: type II secretion system protein GspN [Polyangia bacterium]|nr:type II secretion system protein GspN [Polyangia bacterium]
MNARVQALVDRLRAVELTERQRRTLTWVGYPLFAVFVALLAFYWSVPRERVKDRLETALSADVTSGQPLAIGMDVDIGELSLRLFTGLGFKATDIVLRTRPLTPGEKPARYIIDDVRVRLGLLSTLVGRASYSFVAHALSGSVEGQVSGNNDETKAQIEIDKLVLNGVPGIQQSFGGLPVDGSVSGKLDVIVPKNLLANANGTVEVDIEDAVIGDGKAKLTVPNDPFLAAGVTFPRIKLGKLSGQIVIEKGRARFEGVRVHSADADATLDGYVELHDPIGMSQMHAYLKFRPSEALIKREATVELLTNAMAGTAKRSDGFIGIQMTGPLSAMFFLPSKDPPFGVTSTNEPAPASAPAPRPAMAPPPTPAFMPPPNNPSPPPSEPAPPATGNSAAPPSGAATGSGVPAAGGTPGPGAPGTGAPGTGAPGTTPPAAGTPPPTPSTGGTELAAPPPTGAGVAPSPSVRSMHAEPAEPAPPAKTE